MREEKRGGGGGVLPGGKHATLQGKTKQSGKHKKFGRGRFSKALENYMWQKQKDLGDNSERRGGKREQRRPSGCMRGVC